MRIKLTEQVKDDVISVSKIAEANELIKKKELIRQIKEDFKCSCSMASLKEPIEIIIKCGACGHNLLRFPLPGARKMLDSIADGGGNVQETEVEFFVEGEYDDWYKCLNCGCKKVIGESNYCYNCGKKIKRLKE